MGGQHVRSREAERERCGPGCFGRRSPDVEVLHVDVLVRGRLSLAPEKEPFLGRGLCKTHEDGEHRPKTKRSEARPGGLHFRLRHEGHTEPGGEALGQSSSSAPSRRGGHLLILTARQAPRSRHSPGVTPQVAVTGQGERLNLRHVSDPKACAFSWQDTLPSKPLRRALASSEQGA